MSDTEKIEKLEKCLEGLLEILEGESGAGANFWEQDWRYLQAVKMLESCAPDKGKA